jgi:ATP-dependent RNA helicase DDX1
MSGGFEDLGLLHELIRATSTQGWLLPSDVQDESIPLILGGGDVLVAAETGSGKTGAFALPAIQIVHETRRAQSAALEAANSNSSSASSSGSSPPKSKKARHHSTDGSSGGGRADKHSIVLLSLSDRSSMVSVSEDGLAAQCRLEKDWGGVRGNIGVLKGSAYYEATMTDEGLCRLGWSTQAGSHNLGTDKFGFGFGGTGKKSTQGKFDDYGESFKFGDVIGCCLQVNSGAGSGGSISWTKNGRQLGEAFLLQKGVGTLYPALCMKNAELKVNFGASPFRFPPPAGFVGISQLGPECLVGGGSGVSVSSSSSAKESSGGKKSGAVHPVCLILEPARDLALQTGKQVDELKRFVESPTIGCGVIIGGMNNSYVKEQVAAATDIVVACLQTLQTCIDKGDISLDQIRLLILDEADRFTERENLEMLDKLFKQIRSTIDTDAVPGRLQVCFFSATLHSPEITALAAKMCVRPTWVDLKGKDSVPETVHHVIVPVDPVHDRSWLDRSEKLIEVTTDGVHAKDSIGKNNNNNNNGSGSGGGLTKEEKSEGLKRLKPRMLIGLIDSLKMTQCLIFCRTNVDCDNLEAFLTAIGGGTKWRAGAEKGKENAYSCCVLAGMRGQEERTRNLQAFKDGDVRFLICTDVAARGLDIKELPYVINMTLPDEPENYIHRIGRVGRADRMGLAISFVAASGCDEKVWFHTCSNRGKGCSNTNLVQNMEKKTGGCCIWYDEPGKFKAVKKRLALPEGKELPLMQVSKSTLNHQSSYVFALPKEIADLGVEYGEEKGGKQETSDHVLSIASQVSALLNLEVQAQQAYLSIKTKWKKGL